MIPSTVWCWLLLGQVSLPGSGLSLPQAKEEAHLIVVAEVGKTGERLNVVGNAYVMSIQLWTELKPSAVLKGRVSREELNRLPLGVQALGSERLPTTGDEFIFFIGNRQWNGSITKVLAKTEENLAAIRLAAPFRDDGPGGGGLGGLGGGLGGLGGGLGGPSTAGPGPLPIFNTRDISHFSNDSSPRPLNPEPPPIYQGTRINPGNARGDERKARHDFAAMMSREDPKPEERQAHFAWLFRNETARRYGVSQIGWWGAISKMTSRPGGGWLVTVSISPWFTSKGFAHNFVTDSVEETYEFHDGGIRLVASDALKAKPDLQHYPFAF